LYMCVVV